MNHAWIEGKKRVGPWRIKWREKDPLTGKAKKFSGATIHRHSEAIEAKEAKDAELAKIAGAKKRQVGAIIGVTAVFDRWSKSQLALEHIRLPYATEARHHWAAICKANGWETTKDITTDSLDLWIGKHPGGRGTHKPLIVLRSVLNYAWRTLKQPVDQGVFLIKAKRRAQRPMPHLLTDEQVAEIIERAATFGFAQRVALEHLATYGCRPADLCRLLVESWDRKTRRLTLKRTKNGRDVTHAVREPHASHLDKLAKGRLGTDPLFTSPDGSAWEMNQFGSSRQIVDWYRANITPHVIGLKADQRGISLLKDYAISRMDRAGIARSTRALFTGHLTTGVFERYEGTNEALAQAALKSLPALPVRSDDAADQDQKTQAESLGADSK